MNAMAAIAAGVYFGITPEDAAKGLSSLKVTGMRLELMKTDSGISIINDAYNASPTSMKAAIQLTESLEGYGKKWSCSETCLNSAILKKRSIKNAAL